MGGPSRESYLAVRARLQERLDAMRTRGGVVDLAEWRVALEALAGLEDLLHDPPWLLSVRLAPAPDVGFELRLTMLWDSPQGQLGLPSSVNDVPVRVIVRNPRVGKP